MGRLMVSSLLGIALCWAALYPPALTSQTPARPGKLVITSTPPEATITVNGRALEQLTPSTFLVPQGKYKVAVSDGPGNLNCAEKEVLVTSGQSTELHCTAAGWK